MALTLVIVLSVLFAATHILMSHGIIRKGLVDKLGEWGFRGVYSAVSLVTLVGAIVIFWKYRASMGEFLWMPTHWTLILTYPLVLLAFLLLGFMVANPSPTGMMPAAMEPRGVLRITRHPMNMGIAAFALGHMASNPRPGELFLFGSLFVVGFFGAYHQDRRKAREKGDEFKEFQKKTSILPFAALVQGKTRLELRDFSFIVLVIVLIAFVAMLYLHGRLFGVYPY